MRKFVFGPILSRRLGRSLGVDLVPHKTCPLDCIYCEAKATTLLTMERKEYVPVDEVLAELKETLEEIETPDFITFSGAGEPTLNSNIGRVIDFVRKNYPECKVCLLTNGLLLSDENLQEELRELDMIIPSLDASNEAEYNYINRPCKGETLEKLVDGLCSFRKRVPVPMALEIFIVPDINDSKESMARFRELVERIKPDSIQLNTLDRGGVIEGLRPAGREKLEEIAAVLEEIAPVGIFGPVDNPQKPHIC